MSSDSAQDVAEIVAKLPKAQGRMATCAYGCGNPVPSSPRLAFFEDRSEGSRAATQTCKHCRCYPEAHRQAASIRSTRRVLDGPVLLRMQGVGMSAHQPIRAAVLNQQLAIGSYALADAMLAARQNGGSQ